MPAPENAVSKESKRKVEDLLDRLAFVDLEDSELFGGSLFSSRSQEACRKIDLLMDGYTRDGDIIALLEGTSRIRNLGGRAYLVGNAVVCDELRQKGIKVFRKLWDYVVHGDVFEHQMILLLILETLHPLKFGISKKEIVLSLKRFLKSEDKRIRAYTASVLQTLCFIKLFGFWCYIGRELQPCSG